MDVSVIIFSDNQLLRFFNFKINKYRIIIITTSELRVLNFINV